MSWCCITFDFEVSCWANCLLPDLSPISLPLAVKWPETWKAPRRVKSPNPPCLRPPAKWSRWMIMRHLLQHLMILLYRFVYTFHVFLNHWNLQFLDVFIMMFLVSSSEELESNASGAEGSPVMAIPGARVSHWKRANWWSWQRRWNRSNSA